MDDIDEQLDAQHFSKRKHMRKVLGRFTLPRNGALTRQDFGHVYGLFNALLQFLVTNDQKLQAMTEKINVLEQGIDDLVSRF